MAEEARQAVEEMGQAEGKGQAEGRAEVERGKGKAAVMVEMVEQESTRCPSEKDSARCRWTPRTASGSGCSGWVTQT